MILSAEEFVRLRTSDVREEYVRAADEGAPVGVWRDIISRFPEMREWVAHNRMVPLEVLEILAHDSQSQVRAVVAGKRKLSAELFELLSQDSDEVVRQRVAYNKKAPMHIIKRLALDQVPMVSSVALLRLQEQTHT